MNCGGTTRSPLVRKAGGDCFFGREARSAGSLAKGGVMVDRIWTADLGGHVGERVRLAGWVHRVRRLSKFSFLILRDASGLAQIVLMGSAATIGALHS